MSYKNPEKQKQYLQEWRKAHPDYFKRWKESHPDYFKERRRKKVKLSPESREHFIAECLKEYRQELEEVSDYMVMASWRQWQRIKGRSEKDFLNFAMQIL